MDNKQAAKIISENLTSFYGYAFARLYDKNDVDDLTSEIVYEILRSSSRLSDESAFWAFCMEDCRKYVPEIHSPQRTFR